MRKIKRSAILFTTGLAGTIAETIYSLKDKQAPDSTLVLLFAAMMGLPVFLTQDLKGRNSDNDTTSGKNNADDSSTKKDE